MILLPAMMLFAYGGYVFLVANLQLANLIPQSKSTIISLYCGAYDSSAFTMVLVKASICNVYIHMSVCLVIFSSSSLACFCSCSFSSLKH